MQKSNLPVGIKTLYKYYSESKTLDMDCPIQRASGQWNNLAASMLIHSILSDYIIPNLYFRKESKDGRNYLSVLDGKQRLSTVFSFINDEWMIHAKTPKVVLDGEEYDISLKKFSELDNDIQSAIMGYRFTSYQLENCTDEEIEETFARLNAGTPLSKIQQARPKMGMELADWCNKLVETPFFQTAFNLTVAQLRREDDFLMLLTCMMLLDERYPNGFSIKTSASAAECVRFAEHIKNNYPEEKRREIEQLVEYLNLAFHGNAYKFFRKNNIPIVMYNAKIAVEHQVPANEYTNVVIQFFENNCNEAYNEASGSDNVKLINIQIRLKELLGYLMSELPQYFEKEGSILVDSKQQKESFSENVEVKEETSISQEESNNECEISEKIIDNEDVISDESINDENKDLVENVDNEGAASNENMTNKDKKCWYVLFHLRTNRVGEEQDDVYEVESIDEDYLNALGYELAEDNAHLYGTEQEEEIEEEQFSYSWEVLEGMTKEEIEEEYGKIFSI